MNAQIVPVPCLNDNYAYLIHDPATAYTVVVDPSEANTVSAALRTFGWKAGTILNTHHHWDHVGGNADLKNEFGLEVIAPEGDLERVSVADREEGEGLLQIGPFEVQVLSIPGHTRNHVAYYFKALGAVFTGDTLFTLGCGRLFEGTAAQMTASLEKLRGLPDNTLVYCGHEYFEANLAYALSVDPDNAALKKRAEEWKQKLQPRRSVPSTIALEAQTNPFLAVLAPSWRETRGFPANPVEAFASLRRDKDDF